MNSATTSKKYPRQILPSNWCGPIYKFLLHWMTSSFRINIWIFVRILSHRQSNASDGRLIYTINVNVYTFTTLVLFMQSSLTISRSLSMSSWMCSYTWIIMSGTWNHFMLRCLVQGQCKSIMKPAPVYAQSSQCLSVSVYNTQRTVFLRHIFIQTPIRNNLFTTYIGYFRFWPHQSYFVMLPYSDNPLFSNFIQFILISLYLSTKILRRQDDHIKLCEVRVIFLIEMECFYYQQHHLAF